MLDAGETTILVTDANVLINFCHIGRIDLLGELPGYRLVIPAEVVAEITDESQRAQVTEAIERNILERIDIADPEELEAYAELVAFLGRGEAACLAIAQNRGYAMASDDKKRKFYREASRRLGTERIMGTVQIALMAIRGGAVGVDEADGWLATWRSRRFDPGIRSFSELV